MPSETTSEGGRAHAVPGPVVAAAERSGLGPFVQAAPVRSGPAPARRIRRRAAGSAVLAVVVTSASVLVLRASPLPVKVGVGVGVGIGSGCLALLVASRPRPSQPRLFLFENGIVDAPDVTAVAYPFHDVQRFTEERSPPPPAQGPGGDTWHRYELHVAGRRPLVFGGADGGTRTGEAALGELAMRHFHRTDIESSAARMKEGQTLRFGPLSLSSEGIGDARSLLAWSEIRSIDARHGQIVVVGQERDPMVVDFNAVDTATVVLVLADRFMHAGD